MNKESHSLRSIQDFSRNVGASPALKRYSSMPQTGEKRKVFEHQMCVNGLMTEPRSPWENSSKHTINDLEAMTIRNMKEFNDPLN